MDISTILGIIALFAFLGGGVATKQIPLFLFNMHAVFVVMGGMSVAMLLNTPMKHLMKAASGFFVIFNEGDTVTPQKIIPIMVGLAEQCRMRGMSAFKEADPKLAAGFLARASAAALEYSDHNFVKQVMEQEINQGADEFNEVINVYRTMGILAPMFGLLGTLIGIVGVLKDLANPESVGPAMAVAITSAFYGIFFANVVCVPVAGKLRSRLWMEVRMKAMILDGVLEIMKGSLPLVVERRLQSYLA